MQVPFLSFRTVQEALKREMQLGFERFYDRGWYILGEELKQFESAYAQFNQTNHCVGVSNGLDALTLALKALGAGPGDEVIVPSNTFIATVLAVSHTGAVPVFAEPDVDSYNITPATIALHVSKRTRAIIPVHLYGQSCAMNGIMDLAVAEGLFVVEDNAQAQGARCKDKLTGSWGHINATSFYPGKNLGALGDAGAITTDDEAYAAQVRLLRNYGSAIKYQHEITGHNMRMDELQAVFLRVKLRYLHEWNAYRQQVAGWYRELLADAGDLVLPAVHADCSHVYHLFVVRTQSRDALQQFLQEKGVGTLIHYPVPPHLQQAYRYLGYRKGDFPIAEMLASTCLSLPVYPGITAEEVGYVCDCIKLFFGGR
ncbi:MAG TPA: DegT/DnrJ/EryC1/StrS family aminotransferase [Panacibacter sp.]|nr:DegT/DnrJ/EryC1/StrS family aminotransferase [Panacibacter sp.]HNP46561.1 DegT/DnrJ/EryC1/StrS family aminotransferase [Panacibacter sp.]